MADVSERANRIEGERTERRRRDDATLNGGLSLKLAVPPEIKAKLTEQGREWRWANDVGNRLYQLTKLDDWDKVEGVEPVDVVIDKAKGGTVKAYLLSKPAEFMRADREKKDSHRRATEQAMVDGKIPRAGNEPAVQPSNTYVPTEGRGGPRINKIASDAGTIVPT